MGGKNFYFYFVYSDPSFVFCSFNNSQTDRPVSKNTNLLFWYRQRKTSLLYCFCWHMKNTFLFSCHMQIWLFIGNLLVSFDLYYPINLVPTFSWPLTCDTRNYQLLFICHARSNVTSLNLSLKKKVKTQQNHKAVLKLWNYR